MSNITTGKQNAIFDDEFENIFISIPIKQFNEMGFSFGDSINIYFDNGTIIEDIPYFSGYYAQVEELMLCGYPGDPYIKLARNCGNPTWNEFNMNSDSKLEITLNEKGKYLDIQELFSLEYSDNKDDFKTDEMYSNFRELVGGNIKHKYFFRSTSPCDNLHKRASCADSLVRSSGINLVLNLSNSESKYESFVLKDDFNSPYYDSLYRNGNVLLLQLNVNYWSKEFKKKLADGFRQMIKKQGPVLIHCVEGKDRTGFVCATLLSLAKASYQEIIDDYMLTYDNYYLINKENNPKKYNAILKNIYDFLYCIGNGMRNVELDKLDLYNGIKNYLKDGGLNDEEIRELERYISK